MMKEVNSDVQFSVQLGLVATIVTGGEMDTREDGSIKVAGPWSEFYEKEGMDIFTFCRFSGTYKTHLRLCEEILERDNSSKVLEIGVGRGLFTAYFALKGYSVTGIDSDAQVVEIARRNCAFLRAEATIAVANMFNMPFPDNSFDMIIHQGLMEHFGKEEIVRALEIQCRKARWVVFSVPGELYGSKDFGNENLWPFSTWMALLSKHFNVLTVRGMWFCRQKVASRVIRKTIQLLQGAEAAERYKTSRYAKCYCFAVRSEG